MRAALERHVLGRRGRRPRVLRRVRALRQLPHGYAKRVHVPPAVLRFCERRRVLAALWLLLGGDVPNSEVPAAAIPHRCGDNRNTLRRPSGEHNDGRRAAVPLAHRGAVHECGRSGHGLFLLDRGEHVRFVRFLRQRVSRAVLDRRPPLRAQMLDVLDLGMPDDAHAPVMLRRRGDIVLGRGWHARDVLRRAALQHVRVQPLALRGGSLLLRHDLARDWRHVDLRVRRALSDAAQRRDVPTRVAGMFVERVKQLLRASAADDIAVWHRHRNATYRYRPAHLLRAHSGPMLG